MKEKLKKEDGFTLLESILSAILLSILAMGVVYVFRVANQSFFWYASRSDALHSARHGMNQIQNELSLISSTDIVTIQNGDFGFYDSTSTEVHYQLGSYDGSSAVLRGSNVLIPNAQSLSFTYYNENGSTTSTINDVRKIVVNLTVNAENNNGTINLSTTIYPRSFMYTGFQ